MWLARVPLIDYFSADRVEPLLAGVGHYRFREVDVDIQVLIIIIIPVLGRRIAHASLSHIGYLRVDRDRLREKATSFHQIVIWVIGYLSDLRDRCIYLCLSLSHRSVMVWFSYRVSHGHYEGVTKIHSLNGVGPQSFNLGRI